MRGPNLFDVLTLGVFWRMDKRQEDEIEQRRLRQRQLALKEREVEALEKLADLKKRSCKS